MSSPEPTHPTVTLADLRDETEIPRGATIHRYVVVGVLGAGGMGRVYRAYDSQLNRTLAIKVLHQGLVRGDEGVAIEARMLREARAMARLTHPNVVTVHDVGTFEGRVFLAMEFVDGGTLKDWLRQEHTLAERLSVLESAGRGLAAAHAAGLVHRDFKPENVLVGKDGRVLVTDFGIARIADESEQASRSPAPVHADDALAAELLGAASSPPASLPSTSAPPGSLTAPLTATGSILGTVGYMAPEQAFGEAATAASDQFSFCVTAYHALYGARPFSGRTVQAYLTALDRPLGPAPAGASVPAWIHRVLVRGLSRDAEDRFPSMDALLAALGTDPAVARRKQRRFGLAALAAGAAVVAGGFALNRRAEECAPDASDLKGVWDDAVRTEMTASFERSGAADAREVAARVIGVLDDTAAKWTSMKAESCEATRIKKRQPEEAYQLRSDCLGRRRGELRALSVSLRAADESVVKKATSAAYGLTNVAVCSDVAMLRKSGGLPDAPLARAQVLEARGILARALSLELVGKLAESTKAAEEGLALARTSGHQSAVAEALRILGGLAVEQNEHTRAEPFLAEATWAASRVGADALVVSSASFQAFVVGAKLGRPGEARIWLGVADAALARVGPSPELELEYEEHKSWVLADEDGQAEETLPAQERIARTYQELYGTHPRTLRALYNLGDALTSAGRHARACEIYARAIPMAEAIGGETYGWTGYSRAGLGDCLVAQGEYAKGDAELERAVATFEAIPDDYSEAEALEVVIRSALAQGDTKRAVATARKTIEKMSTLDGTASLVAIVDVPVAEALMRAPPAPEAEALCADALREQEKLDQVDPSKTLRADALRCLGEARTLAGRPAEAIAPLERSLTIPRRTYPGDLARARFALAQALRLSGGDDARALELARQARDELAATPGLAYEADVVRRWLAK